MDRGTYIAASGGLVQMRRLEVLNNNLANVNTPGFKRQVITSEMHDFDQTLASKMAANDPFAKGDHERTPGTVQLRTVTDFTQGPIKHTGNKLDVALRNPNDFFVVQTGAGTRYTRAGNFTLNAEGELVTPDGNKVQGDGGAIAANGLNVSITPSGSVRADNAEVGVVQVVRFPNLSGLEREGDSLFKIGNGVAAPQNVEGGLVPASLEMANVSSISSVVDLITTNRAFEMYTKSAQTIDTMNQTAITQLGRRS